MNKKIFTALLVLASLIVCALSFAACNLFKDDEHTHTIIHQSEKASTCSEEGNREYWYCNSCGVYFSDENGTNKVSFASLKIEKLPHTEVTDAAVPKTCTTDGKTEGKHCSVCNEVTVPQTTVKAGHFEVLDKGKAATCTTDGLTDGRHCNDCSKVTLEQKIIPAGHSLQTDKGKEATCTETGLTDGEHCTVCNYVKKQEIIPMKAHTEVTDSAVAATCTTDGKTEGKHCSVCNTVTVKQQTIPAAHVEVTDAAVAATCTSTGKTEGMHCSVCKTVLVEQKLIPITHSGNGALCDICEALIVPASVGLELTPITAKSASFSGYAGNLDILGYEIKGRGTCTDANVVIPQSYNGKPVLGIGLQAFMNDTILTSIVFPSGFQYIGTEVCFGCANLKTVTMASSVNRIESGAFYYCTSLSSINISPNVTVLYNILVGTDSLITLNLSVNLKKIQEALDIAHLTDIYYDGTKAQWQAIDSGNYKMWNSYQTTGQTLTIHCSDGNLTITGQTFS